MAILVYTDGSCHTQLLVGAWASIIFLGEEKLVLSGTEHQTTHHRMELLAVINALQFIQEKHTGMPVNIVADSQYVIGLIDRQAKLNAFNFVTKKGNTLPNTDLIKIFYALLKHNSISFTKIKSHLPKSGEMNYNIEVDELSRKLVREAVDNLGLSFLK